eukprot:3780059-Amphidinium_carterae.2
MAGREESGPKVPPPGWDGSPAGWRRFKQELRLWRLAIPAPVGVFTCSARDYEPDWGSQESGASDVRVGSTHRCRQSLAFPCAARTSTRKSGPCV